MKATHREKRKSDKLAKAMSRARSATVTVAELRSNFKAIEAKLSRGVRVQVTRRGEVVAEILAPSVENTDAPKVANHRPDFEGRLRRIWGEHPFAIDTNALISEGRERDRLS